MQQTKSRAKKILLVTWIVPCFLAGPFLYPSAAMKNVLESHLGSITRLTCFILLPEDFIRIYYTFLFVILYLLPLIFIAGTCFKVALCLLQEIPAQRQGSMRRHETNRRKVAKMVLMVILAFVICWTPYFLVTIVTQYQSENFLQRENFFFTMLCINLLGFINSCVNPFIYCAMSARFRHGFRRFFRSLLCLWVCQEPEDLPHSDVSLASTPTLKRRQICRRPFQCQAPMSCLITQSSSESGSGGQSDSAQHTTVENSRNSILWSASQKFKRNFIVHYIQRNQSLHIKNSIKSCRGNLEYTKSFKAQNELVPGKEPFISSFQESQKGLFSKSANDLEALGARAETNSLKKSGSCSNVYEDKNVKKDDRYVRTVLNAGSTVII